MFKYIFLALMASGIYFFFFSEKEIKQPYGILAKNAPFQKTAAAPYIYKNNYRLTPQATYDITARVLKKKHYGADPGSGISPYDLALGWQKMSDSAVLEHLKISQSGRWYYYSWGNILPLQPTEISTQSANTHIIPANDNIEKTVSELVKGNVIRMKGYLVRGRWSERLYMEQFAGS